MRLKLIAGLGVIFAGPASAIELGMPLDCTFGVDCVVQNYVDVEPGPGVADFECGSLSYDNHEGTDFRLLSEAKIAEGFAVLATAPGTVRHIIDNQPDHGFRDADISPFSCGNAVVIEHADGWSSQYCHLAEGSLTVKPGDRVTRGQKIALLGSSGGTDFPHLHYALRRYGITVDPYTGVSPTGCEALQAGTHWAEETEIGYVGSAVMGFGVTGVFPSKEAVLHDPSKLVPPEGAAADVYAWFQMLGGKKGDSIRITILDPEGRPFANEVFRLARDETMLVINVGVTPEDLDLETWPPGTYEARMGLYGDGQTLQQEALRFTLPRASAEHVAIGGEGQRKHRHREGQHHRETQHPQRDQPEGNRAHHLRRPPERIERDDGREQPETRLADGEPLDLLRQPPADIGKDGDADQSEKQHEDRAIRALEKPDRLKLLFLAAGERPRVHVPHEIDEHCRQDAESQIRREQRFGRCEIDHLPDLFRQVEVRSVLAPRPYRFNMDQVRRMMVNRRKCPSRDTRGALASHA